MSCPTVIRVTTAQGPPGVGLPAGTGDAGKFVRKAGSTAYAYELVTPDAVGLPQPLAATDSPTFAGLTLSGLAANGLLFTGTGGVLTRLPLGAGLSIVGGSLVATGTGTVTSVGLSAPTGFSVTSPPVTGSGTLALGFAAGYSLPTDARQAQWDGAVNLAGTAVQPGALAAGLAGKANTGAIGSSGLTMATLRILGRTTTGAGPIETIEVVGATLAGGVLTITGTGGATDLSYDPATRTVASSTGTDAVLPLFSPTAAGLAPASGGGTTSFLRADGQYATAVTSLGLVAPTGFSASAAVTTSGNITLSFAAGYSLPTDARQADWDAAFTQRRTWDGGSQHLDAATGRASLLLGSAAQAAATDFVSATTTRVANVVLAGPATGAAAAPTFRSLVAADLPATAVAAGAYGSASSVGTFSVDAQGRLTAASNVTISIAAAGISDSTATGRAVVTAADAAAGRTAIGAAASGAATGSGLTIATARLLGRTAAGTGALEEISVVGATLSGGVLTITGGTASPGGTSGQVQFNNAGALGGAAGLTIDGSGNIDLGVVTGRLRLPPANASQQPSDVYVSSGVLLFRDTSNAEQRPLIASGNLASVANPAQAFYNLLYGTNRVPMIFNIGIGFTNGSGSSADPTSATGGIGVPHHGVFSTGTLATGFSGLSVQGNTTATTFNGGRNSYPLQQFSSFRVAFLFRIPTLSDGTDGFRVYFGMYRDGGNFANRVSAGLMINGSVVTACATAVPAGSVIETVSATTDTYAANTFAMAYVEWTGTAINVRIIGTGSAGTTLTVNSGFPPESSNMFIGGFIVKTAGTNSRTLNIAQGFNFTGFSALP